MLNERSLNERFLALETKMSDANILLKSGKANELSFFIFDYDPKQELMVRNEVLKLKKNNPNIQEFNLFEIIIELLNKKNGFLERAKKFEKEYTQDLILSRLFQPFLSLEADDNPVVRYFKDNIIDDGKHIVLITGVGSAYPIIRSHTILNKLHPVVKQNPVVMMYPGRYDQKSTSMYLKLFDRLEEDNYYRAFPLEERIGR